MPNSDFPAPSSAHRRYPHLEFKVTHFSYIPAALSTAWDPTCITFDA